MKRRKRIPRSHSRKVFTRGALRMHPRNAMENYLMRGGIRL